ncbi:MAG: hypothetical protein J6K92_08265, partial [Oscillospiraceae bacterium]|nr:hypothetical protein [Oscillospiraceae bacterium]
MVVQHNISALNANRYFGINNSGLSKSLEKLSSGYAINRAGDNAAGLAVSEKMRSQIAGLTQGVKNAEDGISMIQTFEGALTETDNILQRMKTLATQSANGTYQDDVDRDAIQLEFDQLNDELNQIADTDFNGVTALNGGRMADGTNVNNTEVLSKIPTVEFDRNGEANSSVVYSENVNGTVDSAGNGVINVNGVKVEVKSGGGEADIEGDGSAYTVTGITVSAGEIANGGVITAVEMFQATKDKDTTITINGNTYTLDWAGSVLKDADGATVGTNYGFEQNVVLNSATGEITATTLYSVITGGVIKNAKSDKVVGSIDLSQGVSKSDAYNHGTINMTYANSITLQVGARGKDAVNFNFSYNTNGIGNLKADLDCSARGLGTDQLSLATQEKANFAIDKIDNAINKVSMVRATFGAMQNRLEHKIDNMNVTNENITAAESRIRDT